jgi:hypothetical protein
MASNGGHLTLTGLMASYAVFMGIGWYVAGSAGLGVAGVVITGLWIGAILRAVSLPAPEARQPAHEPRTHSEGGVE